MSNWAENIKLYHCIFSQHLQNW